MRQHILYSFRRCPYAMRARMALKVAGIDYEHREVLLQNKPESMLKYSPKGTVPVLVRKDGTVIDESHDMMMWALNQNDPEGWLAADESGMRELINPITGDFKYHLDRYKYASRYDDLVMHGSADLDHREKAAEILQGLEQRLSENCYLMGDRLTLADIATFPFIRQFANVEPDWWQHHDMSCLRKWLKKLVNKELFLSIMEKHPQWTDPDRI